MFDTAVTSSNKQIISAVSGTLVKSHPKSYFMFGEVGSQNANSLTGSRCSAIILQAMVVGDKTMMFEVVGKDDFEQGGDAE